MKRILTILCVLLLIIIVLAGSLFMVRKLFSMYSNIWDTLDHIAEAADRINAFDASEVTRSIDSLNKQVDSLAVQVDHLHRQTFYASDSVQPEYDYSWVSGACPYIAHACGGIDGATYTNSREAFIHNYELGHRIFEIDFNLSQVKV